MRIAFIEFWFRGRLVRAKCFVEQSTHFDNIFVCSPRQNKIFHFCVNKWIWFRPVDGSKGLMPDDLYDELVRAVRALSLKLELEPGPAA